MGYLQSQALLVHVVWHEGKVHIHHLTSIHLWSMSRRMVLDGILADRDTLGRFDRWLACQWPSMRGRANVTPTPGMIYRWLLLLLRVIGYDNISIDTTTITYASTM